MDQPNWKGSNPFCLVIVGEGEAVTLIDLDEPGWVKSHSSLMRAPGRWILARKAGSVPVLTISVIEGEQPYYTARVFKPLQAPPIPGVDWNSMDIRAYGIGKKRLDGHTDRLWVLPGGTICAGDDVDRFGQELITQRMIQKAREFHASNSSDQQRSSGGGNQEGGDRREEAGRSGPGDRRPDVHEPSGAEAQDSGAEQRTAPGVVART